MTDVFLRKEVDYGSPEELLAKLELSENLASMLRGRLNAIIEEALLR